MLLKWEPEMKMSFDTQVVEYESEFQTRAEQQQQ